MCFMLIINFENIFFAEIFISGRTEILLICNLLAVLESSRVQKNIVKKRNYIRIFACNFGWFSERLFWVWIVGQR